MSRPVYRQLELLVRRRSAPFAEVQRARIVLLARDGLGTEAIARTVGCTDRSVRKWKARFMCNPTPEGLRDGHRAGRPATVPVWVRCRLVQLACNRPGKKVPFRDAWTHGSLATELERVTGVRLSESEVGRILRNAELRPHRIRQWLHSPDAAFEEKAKRICQLYSNAPKGAVVLCVDEKPMQVLQRVHPTHADWRDASVRHEFEYKRCGVQVLLAAHEIKTGRVVTEVVPRRTAEVTVSFMDKVARHFRGREIYVVWDNLSTHRDGPNQRWIKFNRRHGDRFHFVFTPTHASWLNQVEIWFSLLHRRVLQLGDFANSEQQRTAVEAFCAHWNRVERHPFRWTWRVTEQQTRLAA